MPDKLNLKPNHSLLIVLALIVITIGVYWPVQKYDFINFDDNVYITQNSRVQSGITPEGIQWAFRTKYFGLWNPIVWVSFMVDYELFGLNAGGYHWTNVILHLLNAVLLFFLLRNLTGSVWRSVFVAALFAVHPMNVESVAWISERKNVLSTFFWFLTMIFYVWYAKKPGWKRYLPVMTVFALGLMTKPMLVTLPFVLLLMDFWPMNRTTIHTTNIRGNSAISPSGNETASFLLLEKVPLFILSAMAVYMTMIYSPASSYTSRFAGTVEHSVLQRIGNACFSYILYMKKLFFPTDLSIHYMHLEIPVGLILLSAFILLLITLMVLKYYRQYPYLPVGWFWYLGTLAPVIGIFRIGEHTMADRYAYVTFIGLFIMLSWGSEIIFSRSVHLKKISVAASIMFIVILTVATHAQIKMWENTTTLFQNALIQNPDNYLVHQILGLEATGQGDYEKAFYHYNKAVNLNSRFDPAYNNKGIVLKKMKRRDEALESFQKAVQMNKSSAAGYYNIGLFYLEDGDLERSIEYSLKAIAINPDYAEAYNVLGIALIEKGNILEGMMQLEKALRINPDYKEASRNLQIAREMQKKKRNIPGRY